jgi:hypothetical protein
VPHHEIPACGVHEVALAVPQLELGQELPERAQVSFSRGDVELTDELC